MSGSVSIEFLSPPVSPRRRTGLVVTGVLGAWFVMVFALAQQGAFVQPPGTPPLHLLAAVLAPLLAFAAAWRTSSSFREFVFALHLPSITAIHAWRFVGLGFVALHVHEVLPGLFAWPAGLGDLAIAVTAPWVAWRLTHRPEYARSRSFFAWNLLGLLDFVVAIGTGAVVAVLATGAPGEVDTTPMAQLPLAMIPCYFVPLLALLHVAALLQVRRMAVASRASR